MTGTIPPEGYLASFRKGVRVETSGRAAPRAYSDYGSIEGALRGNEAGGYSSPEAALKIAAVYRCVTLISGAVATMPLALKRRVGENRVDASDDPLWTILRRRPNPWQTPSQFRRQLQTHLLLRGVGLAMKVRTGNRIAALIPLMPDRVRIEHLDDWSLRYHYQTRTKGTIVLDQADVFHLVGHTTDGVTGLSPIACARETVGLAMEMQRHASRTFANGGRVSATLSHPNELGAEGRARLSEGMDAFRTGGEREGKALILEEGMTYEQMGLSMVDAQFVEGQVANRTEIYMFFGVPPHMAGDTTKTTSWGSGIEQQSLGFVAYTLEDWLTTWEQSIERDLVPDNRPDLFVRFNRSALVRGDITTRYASYATARQWSLFTINEIRALEEMPPIEGGDILAFPGNANGSPPPAGHNGGPPLNDPAAPGDPANA